MYQKVDIHVHASQRRIDVPFGNPMDIESHYICDISEMRNCLESQNIKKAILMSSGESFCKNVHSLHAYNVDCMEMAQKSGGFFRWMCAVNPENLHTIPERLEKFKKQGAVGIGEVMVNQWMDSDYCNVVFTAAQKLEMPVLCHMSPRVGFSYGIADHSGLPLLEATLQKYPDLQLIGHSQVFWMELSKDCPKEDDSLRNGFGKGPVIPGGTVERLLKTYPNLHADLSAFSGSCAIMRDEEYGIHFLELFQNQLMFGTDTTNMRTRFPLGEYLDFLLQSGKLSQSAYTKICFRNAEKLFLL